jgi:hypothetical protein
MVDNLMGGRMWRNEKGILVHDAEMDKLKAQYSDPIPTGRLNHTSNLDDLGLTCQCGRTYIESTSTYRRCPACDQPEEMANA